jgi:hypothetical protein
VPDPVTQDAIREAAEAICPAQHRHRADPAEPACNTCWTLAESALRAGWPTIARELGMNPNP